MARNGEMKKIKDGDMLASEIEKFNSDINPEKESLSVTGLFRKNAREKIIAICMGALLWFVQVYGSGITYKTVDVPVKYADLPPSLSIAEIEPKAISVTFSGPRRKLYFMGKDQVKLTLPTLNLTIGSRSIRIRASDFTFPENLKIENIDPHKVDLKVEKPGAVEPKDAG